MFVVTSTLPILFFLCSFIPAPSKSFTSLPSASLTPVPSHSHRPSRSESPSAPIILGSTTSPETEDSMSRSTIVGLAFGLTLTVAVAYAVLVNHRSGAVLVNKDPPKDANNVGVASHEPWGKTHSSLPLSYMGLNNSMSASSSSSFRDYRFVSVFGPQGNIIPQFNPDKAGAVVLGSICIGGAESSSFSSGPFSNTPGSPSYSTTKSFFSHRRGLDSNSIGAFPTASKDDMSSLSSHQSSSFRNNPKYKAMNRRKRYFPIGRYKSSQSSTHSRSTIPMTHQRQQKIQQIVDSNSQVSIGDWKAVSFMSEQHRCISQGATGTSAAMQQNKFFFETLLAPESPTQFDASITTPKCSQSLPNVYRVGSFDARSSILCKLFQKLSVRAL